MSLSKKSEREFINFITNFICAQIYTHQTSVTLLHVSTRHMCHHQPVFLEAKVALLQLLRELSDDRTYDVPKHVDLLKSDMYIFWCT